MKYKLSEKFPFMVTVPHPGERTIVNEDGIVFRTADPNAIMRPQLEMQVGRQGVDWEWDVSWEVDNALDVFFIEAVHAIQFKLTWA